MVFRVRDVSDFQDFLREPLLRPVHSFVQGA
jgi:hypothetical protein